MGGEGRVRGRHMRATTGPSTGTFDGMGRIRGTPMGGLDAQRMLGAQGHVEIASGLGPSVVVSAGCRDRQVVYVGTP